jgi:hypothetical protein
MSTAAALSKDQLLRKAEWARGRSEYYSKLASEERAKPTNGDWRRARAKDQAIRHLDGESFRYRSIADAYLRRAGVPVF